MRRTLLEIGREKNSKQDELHEKRHRVTGKSALQSRNVNNHLMKQL